MLLLTRALIILLLICSAAQANSNIQQNDKDSTLRMCVSHYPPYQIVLPEQAPIGENIATTNYLFKQLGFTIEYTPNNSFWRCLALLKSGKVDLMSGLLDAPERRQFSHLLVYGSLEKKVFYVNNDQLNIKTFADLEGLRVAVLRGVKQFKQFDNAPAGFFTKVYASDLDAGFRILAAGKVDVLISTHFLDLATFKKNNVTDHAIKEIIVDLDGSSLLYTGLSKQSKIAHLAPELERLSKRLHQNGEFAHVIKMFKQQHPQYYQ
ncbi:amino acid ABC transporter substrate-binding protein, PAAT family [Colwellia chukchiensis]|uniref:Amino acid ABC transporter substrate-binding protein, PAAT family n=1 Tax=Colwellia chukchiensis TaxID=641665 RepID=A0A1H7QBZ5_9GAMM|nr:transporter substrate-binding domain-containing protein [Colwellia chukchiensis]SEL45278.1 amino acid ABC transporter substrate-binding protein, PAAT family [Colwellia chukchiensis]